MRLFIRAVNRPTTNVYSTLASLATRDPMALSRLNHIHIVSGDGDREFLAPLQRTDRLTVHFGFPETYAKIATWKPKRRAAWSYLYFLELAISTGDSAIVMEDDVVAANMWHSKLIRAIEAAHCLLPNDNWALSAYFGFPKCPFTASTNLVERADTTTFWGNLMTVWPRHMLAGAHQAFRHAVANLDDMSTDLTVQQHLKSVGGALLYTMPSIVQHAGDTTTLRPDGRRRSPIYSDGYDEEIGFPPAVAHVEGPL